MTEEKQINGTGFVAAPIPENDDARIEALLSYQILDAPDTETFDDLTKLAAEICQTPIATVTMVDKFRQWFASYVGLSDRENPREYSFCAHAIVATEEIYIVDDATQHERFADNPLVKGEPNIVFYAGVPLVDKHGFALGTLCVIDREKRQLKKEQLTALKVLARQVIEKLEFRRSLLQISASKRALEESKERFEIALSAGKLGSYDADLTTGLMNCTEQCKKNYGRTKDDTLNMNDLFESILPEYRTDVQKKIDEALKNNSVYQAEYPVRWPDGSIHWVSVQGRPVQNTYSSNKRIVGVTLDITERKLEEQRKDAFLSIASHELRTPVTSLKTALQLLDHIKHEPYSQMHLTLIEQSGKSMDRLTLLINNLLDTKQIVDSQLVLHKTRFNLRDLIYSSCNHIALHAHHELVITGDTAIFISADEHRVEQVLINLVNNCVKYAPESKQIFVDIQQHNTDVTAYVRDTGTGIPAADQPFLFDRYFRSVSGEQPKNGLGLGLYISQEIIRRHGGKMGLESTEGKGSTFWFTLPIE